MLPAQHTTFNTLDNWAIKTPPNQKGKGPERKGYRVMAQNMYTIHSVTHAFNLFYYSCVFSLLFCNYTTVKQISYWLLILSVPVWKLPNYWKDYGYRVCWWNKTANFAKDGWVWKCACIFSPSFCAVPMISQFHFKNNFIFPCVQGWRVGFLLVWQRMAPHKLWHNISARTSENSAL